MYTKLIAAAFVIALSFSGCQQPPDAVRTGTADLDALEQVRDRHVAAVLNQDVEAGVATYSNGAVVVPPNHPGAVGTEEIRSWLQGTFESFTVEQLEMTFEQYTLQEELAAVHYRYSWAVGPKGGEPIPDTGQGLFVFERQPDGSWLIAYDLWNSDGTSQ